MTQHQYADLWRDIAELKLPPYEWLPDAEKAKVANMSQSDLIAFRTAQRLTGEKWPWENGHREHDEWKVSIGL